MNAKAVLITLAVVVVGSVYLLMATIGPLKDMNLGLGLTAGLASQKIAGGYSLANVVLFVVFAVIIAVLAYLWMNDKKKTR